jgi:Mn2+/Fe2+ NRAMP family transporter
MLFALMTLFGLIVMPFLIWIASSRVLGPYTHGQNPHAGPLALVADYYTGLAHGSAVFWCVALGPAVLVLLIRVFMAGWRA